MGVDEFNGGWMSCRHFLCDCTSDVSHAAS